MSIVYITPKNSSYQNYKPSETQLQEKEVRVTSYMNESTNSKANIGQIKTNKKFGSYNILSTYNFKKKQSFELSQSDNLNERYREESGYGIKETQVFTMLNDFNNKNNSKSKIDVENNKSDSDIKSFVSGVSRISLKTSLPRFGSNFCRICHGGKSFADLLSPCNCKGSIALAHLECLEHWLRESGNSHCELCQHHFQIIREPKYSIPMSILIFMKNPGEQYGAEMILDSVAFLFYTPLTVFTTYLLMLICENYTKATLQNEKTIGSHLMVFASIFGMAAIDFTYSSWIMLVFQKYIDAWKIWYRTNCNLRVILPSAKEKEDASKQNEKKRFFTGRIQRGTSLISV